MAPNVLKVATSFGGSMSYGNRKGIGRFGMGMKTAALSISPVMELYSWQEASAFYGMTLDTDAIGRDRSNLVPLPEPSFNSVLPEPVIDMFTRPVGFPKDATEQQLLAPNATNVYEELGTHGTIVFMPDCDRLGARSHGLLNVTDDDFFAISIPLPELDEQCRIAELLKLVDCEISLFVAQRDSVERQRTALQNRFLGGESVVP